MTTTEISASDSKIKGKRDGKLAAKTGATSYEESKEEVNVNQLGGVDP